MLMGLEFQEFSKDQHEMLAFLCCILSQLRLEEWEAGGNSVTWVPVHCESGQNAVYKYSPLGFPPGPVVKNSPCNAEDTALMPGPGRSNMLWSN